MLEDFGSRSDLNSAEAIRDAVSLIKNASNAAHWVGEAMGLRWAEGPAQPEEIERLKMARQEDFLESPEKLFAAIHGELDHAAMVRFWKETVGLGEDAERLSEHPSFLDGFCHGACYEFAASNEHAYERSQGYVQQPLNTDRVRQLRVSAGLSPSDMTEKLGLVPPVSWEPLEAGTQCIHLRTLQKLASLFEVAAEELLAVPKDDC